MNSKFIQSFIQDVPLKSLQNLCHIQNALLSLLNHLCCFIDSHYLHCCIQVPRKVYTSGFTLEKLLGSSFSFSAQW